MGVAWFGARVTGSEAWAVSYGVASGVMDPYAQHGIVFHREINGMSIFSMCYRFQNGNFFVSVSYQLATIITQLGVDLLINWCHPALVWQGLVQHHPCRKLLFFGGGGGGGDYGGFVSRLGANMSGSSGITVVGPYMWCFGVAATSCVQRAQRGGSAGGECDPSHG